MKLSVYLPDHLPTWFFFKDDPILQVSSQEPSTSSKPQLRISQPSHVQSWSNFQDRPPSNHQHLWCSTQDDPYSSSHQSGTPNILQPPNLCFFSQTFRIVPLTTTNIIFYVHLNTTLSFKSQVRNPQCPPSPQHRLSQPNHVQSWWNTQDMPLSNTQSYFWSAQLIIKLKK